MADKEQLEQQKERLKQLRHKVAIFTYLAIHEKAGSCFGKLAFIWATVVILGGFAKDIKNVEFNIVAVLLVIEGARILCRRSEFTVPRRSFIYVLLVGLQISAALATFLLGYYRYFINLNDYNSWKKHSRFDLTSTQYAAIGYFYGFCIADGCFIFLGKGYMLLTFIIDYIYDHKSKAHKLSRVFSYALYVRYIKGSIFEGREIKILSLAVELLQSTDDYEQLAGAQVLVDLLEPVKATEAGGFYRQFNQWMSISKPIPEKTLWAILTGRDVVERLIQMRNWNKEMLNSENEEKIRLTAEVIGSIVEVIVSIVSKKVEKNPNLIVLPPELRSPLPPNLIKRLIRVV